VIFRILGAILLGGGALGAAAGWMTIKYLDARRTVHGYRKRKRSRDWWPMPLSDDEIREAIRNAEPPKPKPLNYGQDFSPGAVWQVPDDELREAQQQIQQWLDDEKRRRRDP